MRVVQLTSMPGGSVASVLRLASGEETAVSWTVQAVDGIYLGSPDHDVFTNQPLDAAGVRAIVAAITAFSRVSAYPPSEQA